MRRLLAIADVRDRAILLLLLDCGLRVSEAAGLRLGDLRPRPGRGSRRSSRADRGLTRGLSGRSRLFETVDTRGTGLLISLALHTSEC
jgi:integrase